MQIAKLAKAKSLILLLTVSWGFEQFV